MSSPRDPTTHPDLPPPYSILSSAELRFPVVAADGSLGNLEEETQVTNMTSRYEEHEDETSLAGSTYEFIDTDIESTDIESRDGHTTASVASTDIGRPDDVASLADTEHSDEESEDEERQDSSVPAYRSLENTDHFDTPTIGRSSGALFEDLRQPLSDTIRFEDVKQLVSDTVSVKHTVEDFDAEQTAVTAQNLSIQNPPEYFSFTIRQTMSKHGLSTKDPLRILYVGSHAAKEDILRKIGSSLNSSTDSQLRNTSSQIYNVIPISAYRPEEIALMHSSGIQLLVEDCITAESMSFEDSPEKPDVIKLRVGDGTNNAAYHSVPDGKGFIVEPHWELPQIAVFYCSSGDNTDAKRTRSLARKFMSRHKVSSLVINHKTTFDRALHMSLDPHSIHMCLESKDAQGRSKIFQRFPIDLTSFLNIEARQMNQNLAYITGLHEVPSKVASSSLMDQRLGVTERSGSNMEKPQAKQSYFDLWNFRDWRTYVPVGLMFLTVLVSVLLASIPSLYSTSAPAISVNSKSMSAMPISSTDIAVTHSSYLSVTSVATSSIAKRSVTPQTAVSHAQRPNSLSIVPSKEIGTLPKSSSRPVKSNKTLCSAEILGDREILIRIPSTTKLSWLTKEAISVNVTRNNITVDTERAYSSDEGIVLLLASKEAYGVLNLSIVTSKKPKVNETFRVDFGTPKSQAIQNAISKIYTTFIHDATIVDETVRQVYGVVNEAVGKARTRISGLEGPTKKAAEQASAVGQTVTDMAKSLSFELAKRSAIVSKEVTIQAEKRFARGLRSLQQARQPVEKGLLKAQVRSKLLWLQIQGKDAEYNEYKNRALKALNLKPRHAHKSWSCKKSKRGDKKSGARTCGGKKAHP